MGESLKQYMTSKITNKIRRDSLKSTQINVNFKVENVTEDPVWYVNNLDWDMQDKWDFEIQLYKICL